jgi:hypothetical protein
LIAFTVALGFILTGILLARLIAKRLNEVKGQVESVSLAVAIFGFIMLTMLALVAGAAAHGYLSLALFIGTFAGAELFLYASLGRIATTARKREAASTVLSPVLRQLRRELVDDSVRGARRLLLRIQSALLWLVLRP